jgi:AcrR family transcriptional regulator
MSPPTAPAESPSRREQNKAATRAAIADAALGLLRSEGPSAVTADRVADAAGVSRRTLFNYFPTVEAALNVPTEVFLEQALRQLEELPADMPIMEAAVLAMRSLADRRALAPVAELFVLSADTPQLNRLQLETWENCASRLVETVLGRVPRSESLEATVFAHSVVGAGKAAFAHWAHHHAGDLSDSSLAALQHHLAEALSQLRDGFPTLRIQAGAAPERKA